MIKAKKLSEIFVETITEGDKDYVISSNLRPATQEDLDKSKALYELGDCPHNNIYDEDCYPYYMRYCYACGKNMGFI